MSERGNQLAVVPGEGRPLGSDGVGKVACRRNGELICLPADAEARDGKAGDYVLPDRVLADMRRRSRRDDDRVVGSVGKDSLDVTRGGCFDPFGIEALELRTIFGPSS